MSLRKLLDYWWIGPLLALLVASYFGYRMFGPDKQAYLPGKTSNGHHQIESACDQCHTPFDGVRQKACLDCHGAGLEAAEDSHAASVFNDPRSYAMLAIVDAAHCVSCHGEHIADAAGDEGLSVPDDFCFPCHKDIADERPSHKGFKEDGCAASGCHNYHDNRALYEDFIDKHLDEPEILTESDAVPTVLLRSFENDDKAKPLTAAEQDGNSHASDAQLVRDWAESLHARAGVNCSDCHAPTDEKSGIKVEWSDKPSLDACKNCHDFEADSFFAGKHGMRLAAGLSPMRPDRARIPMKDDAHEKELTCNTCHGAHRYDTRKAAADACLGCHDDIHSKAYPESAHYRLWQQEIAGSARAGAGVSCATCHMPRTVVKKDVKKRVAVVHNQNANLRPNSKMIRGVCLNCHGLGFTLQSLADPDLLLNNYADAPKKQIETLDMVKKRQRDKQPGE
ncbi:MAG: cytochrome c3 family protein [Gammaproteobacteria bacterium]